MFAMLVVGLRWLPWMLKGELLGHYHTNRMLGLNGGGESLEGRYMAVL